VSSTSTKQPENKEAAEVAIVSWIDSTQDTDALKRVLDHLRGRLKDLNDRNGRVAMAKLNTGDKVWWKSNKRGYDRVEGTVISLGRKYVKVKSRLTTWTVSPTILTVNHEAQGEMK
jgi:hypothetical protein